MTRFLASVLFVLLASPAQVQAAVSVTVNFAQRADPPLVKKFAQYNAGLPPLSSYDRDLDKINELYAEHLRLDLGVGKSDAFGGATVGGTASNLTFNFSNLDALARRLNDRHVAPMYSWCYVPPPFQAGGNWKDLDTAIPNWTNHWRTLHSNYAAHFVSAGIPIGYHEIYNEPDLSDAFLLWNDFTNAYHAMYKFGALGIRDGNPDAVVGGPAYAFPGSSYLAQFLDFVVAEKLPLDFCSYHDYSGLASDNARSQLDARPSLRTTELFLNELNWYHGADVGSASSPLNFAGSAAQVFDVFARFLPRHEVTLVSWAQFMESGFFDDSYGLIRKYGQRKASFNAFKIYADLPVERVSATYNSTLLSCLPGAESSRACAALWSRQDTNQTVTVTLNNLTVTNGEWRLYRIDTNHASYFDGAPENLAPEWRTNFTGGSLTWTGDLPPRGVLYFVASATNAPADFTPRRREQPLGDFVRLWKFFPASRANDNYAWLDRKNCTAWLGMGSAASRYSICAMEAQGLPPVLRAQFAVNGALQTVDANSLLGLRVDFRAGGVFTNSVLFHGGLYNAGRNAEMPWGTKRQAEQVVQVAALTNFTFAPANYAPSNWDGRAILSFIMQNSGANTRARVQVSAPGTPIPARVQAEDCVAFHDTTPGNLGGQYRASDLDIGSASDTGGGHFIGWIAAGEWWTWNLDVTNAGVFDLVLRTATPNANRTVKVELDGSVVNAALPLPNTGGYQNWSNTLVSLGRMEAGPHVLRLTANNDSFNINYLDFKVTRERIRQIEAKALRKMRHPTRLRQLQGFLETSEVQ